MPQVIPEQLQDDVPVPGCSRSSQVYTLVKSNCCGDPYHVIQEDLGSSGDSCLLATYCRGLGFWRFCCGVADWRKQAEVGTRN